MEQAFYREPTIYEAVLVRIEAHMHEEDKITRYIDTFSEILTQCDAMGYEVYLSFIFSPTNPLAGA